MRFLCKLLLLFVTLFILLFFVLLLSQGNQRTLVRVLSNPLKVIRRLSKVTERYQYFDPEIQRQYTSNPNLTRMIHQSWKTKVVPNVFKKYIKSWKECFPEWKYKLWTDDDNRALVRDHYPWFLDKYDSFPAPIFRADSVRYLYMLHFGGVYTDLDNECLHPFEHLLANYSIVFGDMEYVPDETDLDENYIQNSFIYSRPNHPFWIEVLVEIMNSETTKGADVITGPIVLSNMIHKYRTKHPGSHNMKVYDPRYFNDLTWGEQWRNPPYCKIWNGMSQEEYKLCREFYFKKGSYVVQYHSHMW